MLDLNLFDWESDLHTIPYKAEYLVLDVNSGAVHLFDSTALSFLDALKEHQGDIDRATEEISRKTGEDEAKEVARQVLELVERGELLTPRMEFALDLLSMPVKALCLNVAHVCNMACTYCFAQKGNFGGRAGLMSHEVAAHAIDFLIEHSDSVHNLEVDFFGGEPLLNWQVVTDTITYARIRERSAGKHFNFTVTTNGLLLDEEKMNYLVDNGIAVILSLDGRPEVNDRHRVLPGGGGTYEELVPRFKRLVAKNPGSYYIRGTFTRYNLDFAEDARHIIDLGFDNLSLEPAVGPHAPEAVGEREMPQVLAEYERLTSLIFDYRRKGRDVHFFHYNLNINRGPCLAKRLTGCGAGTEYLTITPNGDIYPCHQLVENSDFIMGNVLTGIVNPQIKEMFARANLTNKPVCQKCWARFFCGGGCHANAYFSGGDLYQPQSTGCKMHRKRVEQAILLEVMQKEKIM